ncbi:leucine-rich repeat domain-containing protein, partial [Clostridium perfringens]
MHKRVQALIITGIILGTITSNTLPVFANTNVHTNLEQKQKISTYSNEKDKLKEVITIPDKNLEKALKDKLFGNEDSSNPITKDALLKITTLDLSDMNISNLEGIQNCENLVTLYLSLNQISNIEPLKGLTNLTTLKLNSNQISNIEVLKGLINLKSLDLSDNKLNNNIEI